MTKKRRIFEIDMPEEAEAAATPALETKAMFINPPRRGPMATAIGENADALRRRREQEQSIRSENDTLAHEFVRLKKLGLIVDTIPLDLIDAQKLTRDRARRLDLDLDDLKTSIREVGLSNPIRVEEAPGGRYELIQGYRRLAAYRALVEETGDETYARIPAGLVAKGESLAGLYRRMVDENMVRKDISFAEMGALARAYADDPQSEAADIDEAVAHLFASAGRQKRIYIRHFATLTGALEKYLEFPEAIPRALGLALVKRLDEDPGFVAVIVKVLGDAPKRDAATEVALLQDLAAAKLSPRGQLVRATPSRRGKTVLRLPTADGMARCTAAPGKVELRLERDFSSLDPARFEAAVEAFFRALDA